MDSRTYTIRQTVYRAFNFFEKEPERSLEILKQARAMAEEIDAACLILWCDQWIGDLLLYYLGRIADGLAHSVNMAVEARKPKYHACDDLPRVYRILTDAYVYNDPVGYEAEILKSLTFIETSLNPNYETRLLLRWTRSYLMLALENFDAALDEGLHYLEGSNSSSGKDFRLSDACSFLCELYFCRADWHNVLKYAEMGEIHARSSSSSTRHWLIEFLAWQAFIGRKTENNGLAQRAYHQLAYEISTLGAKPLPAYYDAVCAYHEVGEEFDKALELRRLQLTRVIASGSPYFETECRLRLCRLLKKMQLSFDDELIAAREASKRLLKPEKYLAKLDVL